MAVFKCPACEKLVEEDLRTWPGRRNRGKTKYKSYCNKSLRAVFMMKQK